MNSGAIGCIFIATQALTLSAQEAKLASATLVQTPKPAVQLILSPDHITVTTDSNFTLNLKWINKSHDLVWCTPNFSTAKIDESFIYDVRASNGGSVSPAPGKRTFDGEISDCAVAPDGGTFNRSIGCVMCAFDMRHPGVYAVQISLPDSAHPGHMLGTSNKVTVTVKAQ
jgi:hypothetical protein